MRSVLSMEFLLRSHHSCIGRSEVWRRFTKQGTTHFQLELRRRILKLQRLPLFRIKSDTSDSELNLEHPVVDQQLKSGKLLKRSASGILLGLCGTFVIVSGGLLFSCIVAACAYQVSREFNGLVIQMRHKQRTFAPPISIRELMSVFCLLFPLMNYFYPHGGKSALLLSLAAFILLCMEVLTVKKPKFSQLTAAVFGLFYCGFLPSFWVKLRMLSAPAVHSFFAVKWPVVLGGISHWTVGLVATFAAAICVSFADIGAFFVGKTMGRTQLITISPKKTVEGALGGLFFSTLAALGSWKVLGWPGSPIISCAIGPLVFVSGLFGDLIESILKREAGMKDSGSLIPGHGGLLDRMDSYIFTGAVTYLCVNLCFPNFGL